MNHIQSLTSAGIIAVLAAACGGGGGGPETEPETGVAFLETAPSEAVLCTFVIGHTTESDVLDVLGEPTYFSASSLGDSLQYWVGSLEAVNAGAMPRVLSFSFDEAGLLETPYVQQLPFPECWRNSERALDDEE